MRFLLVLASLVAICAAGTLPNHQSHPIEQRLMQFADQNGDIEIFAEPEQGDVEGEPKLLEGFVNMVFYLEFGFAF